MDSFNKGVEASLKILDWLFQAIMAIFGFFAPIVIVLAVVFALVFGGVFIAGMISGRSK